MYLKLVRLLTKSGLLVAVFLTLTSMTSTGARVVVQERSATEDSKRSCSEDTRTAFSAVKSQCEMCDISRWGASVQPDSYAIHWLQGVASDGCAVEIEDGSVWAVRPQEGYYTFYWGSSDPLIITPNHHWFSSYDYEITNLATGTSIQANLSLGPYYQGLGTHWIVAIDYWEGMILLENGLSWKVPASDSIFHQWAINDTIIIGANDGYFSGNYPNILINVNMNNHLRAGLW